MAITQEQYDSFEEGDIITVATESYNGDFTVNTGKIHFSKNFVYNGKPEKASNGVGFSLPPTTGGRRLTLLKHVKAPKPAWHNAKVIKVGDTLMLKITTGKRDRWIDSYEQTAGTAYLTSTFSEDDITIIVGEDA